MKQNGLACALLVVTVLCAYWPVGRHEFVNFDDPQYLVDNPQVRQGLTWGGIRWAFTTGHAANWHPVTWLSHMIDCQLVGLQAGWHHVIGMLFHIANSVLLYLVFQRMTGAIWRSFMVAALFALHPLHVESVAWAAERKDVLSALFWILSLAAYVRYTAAPSWRSYGVVMVCFALGLMAKPMLVTLPCVLLLLDYWPLGRWSFEANRRVRLRLLIVEKLPLLALSAASCLVTMIVQSRGGAVGSVTAFPVTVRLANAVVAYVAYLGKLIWPTRLAVFYPYHAIATWQWMSAAAVLAGITAVAIITRRRWPYLLVGWLWYLGTLVPVIGVIQVGRQSMADRYTYLPLVGVFVMLVWWITELSARSRWSQSLLRVAAGTAIIVCLALSFLQVVRWRNSVTLFEHCLRVTGNNALAHTSLGADLRRRGWLDEAMTHYREALRINPAVMMAHYNWGEALDGQGRMEEALSHYQEALQIDPRYAKAHNNLGVDLRRMGRLAEAIPHYREALRIEPCYAKAHNNLGIALSEQGKFDPAIEHFREAVRLDPMDVSTLCNLGLALSRSGQYDQAKKQYREAIRLTPLEPSAYSSLAWLLAVRTEPDLHDSAEALQLAEEAARLAQGKSPAVLDTLAAAYAAAGRFPEAVREAEQALALAKSSKHDSLTAEIAERLELYKRQQPFRETAPAEGGTKQHP